MRTVGLRRARPARRRCGGALGIGRAPGRPGRRPRRCAPRRGRRARRCAGTARRRRAFFLLSAQKALAAAAARAPASVSFIARASGGSTAAGRALAHARQRLDHGSAHRRAAPSSTACPSMSATWYGIDRRQRQRRLDRRALDLGAGILERLVGQLEAVALEIPERRAPPRCGPPATDRRASHLSGLAAASGRLMATAPQTAAPAARAAGEPFISARAISSACSAIDEPRVQRQRGGAQARRGLGADRLLQHRPQRRRGRARPAQDQQRGDARLLGRLLVATPPAPARRRTRPARARRSARTAPAPPGARRRRGSAAPAAPRSAATAPARARPARSVAASALRRKVGSGSRSATRQDAGRLGGRQRRASPCSTAARTSSDLSAERAPQRRRRAAPARPALRRSMAAATATPRRRISGALSASAAGQDLVLARAPAADHRQRLQRSRAARSGSLKACFSAVTPSGSPSSALATPRGTGRRPFSTSRSQPGHARAAGRGRRIGGALERARIALAGARCGATVSATRPAAEKPVSAMTRAEARAVGQEVEERRALASRGAPRRAPRRRAPGGSSPSVYERRGSANRRPPAATTARRASADLHGRAPQAARERQPARRATALPRRCRLHGDQLAARAAARPAVTRRRSARRAAAARARSSSANSATGVAQRRVRQRQSARRRRARAPRSRPRARRRRQRSAPRPRGRCAVPRRQVVAAKLAVPRGRDQRLPRRAPARLARTRARSTATGSTAAPPAALGTCAATSGAGRRSRARSAAGRAARQGPPRQRSARDRRRPARSRRASPTARARALEDVRDLLARRGARSVIQASRAGSAPAASRAARSRRANDASSIDQHEPQARARPPRRRARSARRPSAPAARRRPSASSRWSRISTSPPCDSRATPPR